MVRKSQNFLNLPSPFLKVRQGVRRHHTSGFTLIELMIALTLGLLIVAAGLAVFLSSSRALNLQSGVSELQQNANFGLSLITYDLRHTNLNTVSSQRVNSFTVGSGVVFAKENLPLALQGTTDLETKYITLQEKDTDNTEGKSDQLTIQYSPETQSIINCEGSTVGPTASIPRIASDQVIIQRYYLKESQAIPGQPKAYSLMCDAAEYPKSSPSAITGLNTNAQQIMQRVDAFKVRLGVKNPSNNSFRYMNINEYNTAMQTIRAACATPIDEDNCAKNYLQVISIEIGILSRSTGTIGEQANMNTQKTFKLAGQSVTLDGDEVLNKKYLRQAVNQVVAIRNTLGAS